jgi:Xaa-Pro aminopeptidase
VRISDDEIDTRVERLQAELRARGLVAAICFGAHRDYCPADLRYLARWSCTDEELSFVFVPQDGATTLMTDAEWDLERAQTEARAGEVVLDPEPSRGLARLVREHASTGDRVGLSGFALFPTPIYLALVEACPGVLFEDVTSVTAALRRVKSAAEVALLREAARVSDAGMRAGVERIEQGVSEFAVVAAAEYAIRQNGAELSFVTVMGAGPRTAQTTFFPARRAMGQGEFAVLDCGGRIEGYHGDMCRTVVVGRPDASQRQMLEAVAASVDAAITSARPGVSIADVSAAARNTVDDAGLGEFWWGYYMPHGAGTAQHEPPDARTDGELRLEAGMVLCIEPGIAVPDTGAVILEQMIHITPDGAETLNQLPLALWDR